MKQLRADLKSKIESKSSGFEAPKEKKSDALQFFEDKMKDIKTFVEGAVNKDSKGEKNEQPKKKKDVHTDLSESTKCHTDEDCHANGDMGGYCKSNGDCHCTAPFFSTAGSTCELSCTPTSKPAACCRDDTDCQADGDKGAYCKSPKSTPHTTPGNGMCRCSSDFKGTTSCKKVQQGMVEGALDEGTPAWLTGDIERPQGARDMGGWTMRVYTKEQQARLNVDETGEPVKGMPSEELVASTPHKRFAKGEGEWTEDEASTKEPTHPWSLLTLGSIGILLLIAMVIMGLGFKAVKMQSRIQAAELSAVYNQAMKGTKETTSCSQNQI
jgi:hypothetical protein